MKWASIEGYSYYEFSSIGGHVRSYKKKGQKGGRLEKPVLLERSPDNDGYLPIALRRDDGIVRRTFVHILILEAFKGPCPECMEARHLDGDSSNNDVDNLEWGTHLENVRDTIDQGTHAMSIRPPEELVTEIKRRHTKGESIVSIASDLGHSWEFVKRIIKDTHWSLRDD